MSPGRLRLRFALLSDPQGIGTAVTRLGDELRAAGWPSDLSFRLCVCTAELLNNLHLHAYSGATDGPVAVDLRADHRGLRLACLDWGRRPPAKLASVAWPVGAAENGRGLPLLQAWSSRLTVRRCGACSVQIIRLPARALRFADCD